MTQHRYEQLSAWMDGELHGQAEQELLDALLEDEALAATYLRWQEARDLLHQPRQTSFSPTVVMKDIRRMRPVRWARTGWALAASVVLASVFWWNSLSEQPTMKTVASLPVARVTVVAASSIKGAGREVSLAALPEQDRLYTYMMQHASAAQGDAGARLLNYAPVVARVEPGSEVAGDDSVGEQL
ncbi:MAG: sigma-E factor negative regulatory protein [Pseudomonadales bacterium]|nr:sigma-E factor negative regulatory protein [Pseudomonadales bacterium]